MLRNGRFSLEIALISLLKDHTKANIFLILIFKWSFYFDFQIAHQVRSQAHIVGQEVYGVGFVE